MNTRYFYLFLITLFFASCQEGPKVVLIETEYGNMKVELYDSTPLHRDNFVKLVNKGFYDDLLFHRVIQTFMIQGGDPESKDAASDEALGGGGPGYQLPAEIGAPHLKGTLAAARTGDNVNPERKSSGSQFYIVQGSKQTDEMLDNLARSKKITYNEVQRKKYKELGGTPQLDMDYTVFGQVIEGLDVIDKIAALPVDVANRPMKDVKMKIKMIN